MKEDKKIIDNLTETELILKFVELIKLHDPDIITGYNVLGFDWAWLYTRAQRLGILKEFMTMGRANLACTWKIKPLSTAARGINEFRYPEIPGRWQHDVMYDIKFAQDKLAMYSLNYVSGKFLGEHKVDLPAKELFVKFKEGTAKNIHKISEYCIQDVRLCHKLMDVRTQLNNAIGMANVCNIDIEKVMLRGQTIRVQSPLCTRMHQKNFVSLDRIGDSCVKRKEGKEYNGAHVINPKKTGMIRSRDPDTDELIDDHVMVWDFTSLYPTQMMDHNISPDTKVDMSDPESLKFMKINGIEVHKYQFVRPPLDELTDSQIPELYDPESPDFDKKVHTTYFVAYDPERPETRGLLPEILSEFMSARKVFKKKMAKSAELEKETRFKITDKNYNSKTELATLEELQQKYANETSLYDAEQRAYKVVCNCVYGTTGAKGGPLYDLDVAATTTYLGRCKLKYSVEFIEKFYPTCEVIYGDSVVGHTPVLLRNPDNNYIKTIMISDIVKATDYDGVWQEHKSNSTKQSASPNTCFSEIWTKDGWKSLRKVIRHKTKKDLFNVVSSSGIATVTIDHSLIDTCQKQVKPITLYNEPSTQLLKSVPETELSTNFYIKEPSFIDELSDLLAKDFVF